LLVTERGHLSAASAFGGLVVSIVGWLLGIVVLGLPAWWLIETKWGPRRGAALLCGASLPPLWVFLFLMLVQSWGRSPAQDTSFTIGIVEVVVGIPVALVGMGVAWAMWRFAYRRSATRQIADTFS
jgi:hypothetical protein